VAIEALAHLPREATLEIIGPAEEAYRAELETLLRDRELTSRVRFARSSRAELRDRYSSADALLFPVIWDEPFGLVPIEAMACGTPVIGTGTGGSAEFLLDDVNCLVTAPGDHRALADAVQKLAGDESLRQRLIASGYRTAEQLGVDQLADALEDWHVAAAGRFINGQPDDRPSLRDLLRSPGHRQT
jgi:glycosyltransferase involved in cell wall biosynthesis